MPELKKCLAWLICAALFLSAVPFGAAAAKRDPKRALKEQVIQEAEKSYRDSQLSAGKTSFHGTCGLMVSHQMYNLGINSRYVVFDGNDQYDYYQSRDVTSGGYYINAYSAEGYNLEEALLAVTDNKTRDARNILIGFQWTNTVAGGKYGHVVFINGIIDGMVYFVESFDCALGGAEGTVLCCTIEAFAKYYDRWTIFEGAVHFGTGIYHEVCERTDTDLTVQARFATEMRSEPAVLGKKGSKRLRSVAAGEMLQVTAIYYDNRTVYYRVKTNEGFGFVSAGAMRTVQVNTEGMALYELTLTHRISEGQKPAFSGTMMDSNGQLVSMEVCITDSKGALVRRELKDVVDNEANLSQLRNDLYFDLLEPGLYRVEIYGTRVCPVVTAGEIENHNIRSLLSCRELQVGGNPKDIVVQADEEIVPYRDGWFRENGTWFYYTEGKPCTGWITRQNVRYYLQEDGSVTTGSQTVDGKELYFSATGAMVTGWQIQKDKTTFRDAEGLIVTGWQTIGGRVYCFDEKGVLQKNKKLEKDGVVYALNKEGIAIPEEIKTQEAENG